MNQIVLLNFSWNLQTFSLEVSIWESQFINNNHLNGGGKLSVAALNTFKRDNHRPASSHTQEVEDG